MKNYIQIDEFNSHYARNPEVGRSLEEYLEAGNWIARRSHQEEFSNGSSCHLWKLQEAPYFGISIIKNDVGSFPAHPISSPIAFERNPTSHHSLSCITETCQTKYSLLWYDISLSFYQKNVSHRPSRQSCLSLNYLNRMQSLIGYWKSNTLCIWPCIRDC